MNEPVPELVFESLHDAATQLKEAARRAGADLALLPFKRFEPEDSTWWLSPEPENPAFAFGKIIVAHPSVVEGGAVIIGLHVEKGVGSSAAAIFEESARGHRLVMHPNWTWNAFIGAMRSGQLDADLIAAVDAAAGLPLVVAVDVATQFPPSPSDAEYRPYDPAGVECAWYAPTPRGLVLRGREGSGRLSSLGELETMASIAGKIDAIADLDWAWVDVVLGVPVRPVPIGGLTMGDIWSRACAPWLTWVR